jgi:hypothetical protein
MVGQLGVELALLMVAIYLTIPFVFLALAIAALPLWHAPVDRTGANDAVSTNTPPARRSLHLESSDADAPTRGESGPGLCSIDSRPSQSKGGSRRASPLSSDV